MDDAWNDINYTDPFEDDENDPDYNPANEKDSDDESDDAVDDLSDDESEPAEPIQRARTESKRAGLEGEALSSRVVKVLDCIESESMDLAIFLDAVSWGDVSCHKDRRIQYARTSLFVSNLFPAMIQRWYRPPRATEKQKGKRPMGAREIMQGFAVECVMDRVDREMKSSAHLFLSPPEDLNERKLLDCSQLRVLASKVTSPLRDTVCFVNNHCADILRKIDGAEELSESVMLEAHFRRR